MADLLDRLDDCGCCEGVSAQTPVQIANRPGLSAIAYRVGKHSQFKRSLLAALSGAAGPARGEDPAASAALRSLTSRCGRRLHDRAARRLGADFRRADLLPGAHRQRELPAHRHRAAVVDRDGSTHRLPAEPWCRCRCHPGLHGRRAAGLGNNAIRCAVARGGWRTADRRDSCRSQSSKRATARRDCADLRNQCRSPGDGGLERAQTAAV